MNSSAKKKLNIKEAATRKSEETPTVFYINY